MNQTNNICYDILRGREGKNLHDKSGQQLQALDPEIIIQDIDHA